VKEFVMSRIKKIVLLAAAMLTVSGGAMVIASGLPAAADTAPSGSGTDNEGGGPGAPESSPGPGAPESSPGPDGQVPDQGPQAPPGGETGPQNPDAPALRNQKLFTFINRSSSASTICLHTDLSDPCFNIGGGQETSNHVEYRDENSFHCTISKNGSWRETPKGAGWACYVDGAERGEPYLFLLG
jgi:hypothetical protein